MGLVATLRRFSAVPRILWHPRARPRHLRAFRERALRRLVNHAYQEVEFHRERWDRAGVSPDEIRTVEDLHRLPVCTKDQMRRAPAGSILARGLKPRNLIRYRTGGSTGEPFTVIRSRFENHLLEVFRKRADWQLGMRPWYDTVTVTEPTLLDLPSHGFSTLLNALGLFRIHRLLVYSPPGEIAAKLEELKPDLLRAYPHVLARVSEAATPAQRSAIRPKVILCGGERLTDPLRSQIESAFRVAPRDRYGGHEFNLLAWECPQGGRLHICDDGVIIEVLRDGKPVAEGEVGEVAVTSLFSHSQPFIRYRNGDLAIRGPERCPCGQPFSTLLEVVGRTTDYFEMPDGSLIHPFVVTGPILREAIRWVYRCQLVRERADRLTLRIVTLKEPTEAELEQARELGARVLPPGVEFRVEIVDDIPVAPNGKFQVYLDRG